MTATVAFYAICRNHKLPGWIIRRPDRRRVMVRLRTAIATELRGRGFTLPEIGEAMNRHHTSILSLLRGGKHKRAE